MLSNMVFHDFTHFTKRYLFVALDDVFLADKIVKERRRRLSPWWFAGDACRLLESDLSSRRGQAWVG